MTYFLSAQPLRVGETAELTGEEAHHAAGTRRIRPGETFAMQDPSGTRFRVIVEGGSSKSLRVRVIEPLEVPPPPERRVTLIQAALKAKATEWALQKTTELGVARLVFFPAAHSTVALAELRHDHSRGRWERIAWEACKQSDRQLPPEFHVAENLPEALAWSGQADRNWVFHPESAGPLSALLSCEGRVHSVRVLIGPEGGLTSDELRYARDAGFVAARLGPLVLRAETAAVAACALALFA